MHSSDTGPKSLGKKKDKPLLFTLELTSQGRSNTTTCQISMLYSLLKHGKKLRGR